MKICIDPGHGGKDPGAIGSHSKEKDINLKLGLMAGEILSKHKVSVFYTRKKDVYVSLKDRCYFANKNKCDYFISIHCNSYKDESASGTETYCYKFGGEEERLSKAIQKRIVNLNNNKDKGVKKVNFYVLKNTQMPACLIEVMFISNPIEEKKLNDSVWQNMFAQELAFTLLNFMGMSLKIDINKKNLEGESMTSIMGEPLVDSDQAEKFLHLRNPQAPYLAKLYLSIGKSEGVRGDIAFAQALYNTNFLKFDNGLSKDRHEYLYMDGSQYTKEGFATPTDGIRAHIQHLKAFASTARLNTELVDPRFHLVQRGSASYWEDLDKKWDIPKKGYGKSIVNLWREMMNTSECIDVKINKIYEDWRREGIILEKIDIDKPITWRDYLITQNRLLKKNKGE